MAEYEKGFSHYLELSETPVSGYPKIRVPIAGIIKSRYHFADNATLVDGISPAVDAIGRLESSNSSLTDVFKELLVVWHHISSTNIGMAGLKEHAIATAINRRAREFSDPVYFIALFLLPSHKHLAVSKKVIIDSMMRHALGLALAWKFSKCDAVQLHKELLAYKNEDPPFKNVRKTVLSARIFCTQFSGPAPVLRRFALKILSIAPHGAPVERLFSALGLIKTKTRNRLSPSTLSMLGQLKYELGARIANMKIRKARKRAERTGAHY